MMLEMMDVEQLAGKWLSCYSLTSVGTSIVVILADKQHQATGSLGSHRSRVHALQPAVILRRPPKVILESKIVRKMINEALHRLSHPNASGPASEAEVRPRIIAGAVGTCGVGNGFSRKDVPTLVRENKDSPGGADGEFILRYRIHRIHDEAFPISRSCQLMVQVRQEGSRKAVMLLDGGLRHVPSSSALACSRPGCTFPLFFIFIMGCLRGFFWDYYRYSIFRYSPPQSCIHYCHLHHHLQEREFLVSPSAMGPDSEEKLL
ncbi:hypothetical protein J3F83DRAFT_735725 [Trichoderma novae-zelandiae]